MKENPWLSRRIVNFAHQGGAHEAPSSTLYAIEEGLRAGASAVELDVHATKDRVLVVCHDETIDRTTNGAGEICDLELSELQSCDNSYWFIEGADVTPGRDEKEYSHRGKAPKDHSFGIATLEEVLLTFPQTVFNMDIKRTAPEVAPYEELLSATLAKCGRTDDVIVASFNDLAIQEFRRQSPETLTSAATLETANFIRAIQAGETPEALSVVAFQVPETFGELTLVDEQFIEAAHGANIAVHVWTINDAESMERLISLGVDGIISDRPSLLTSVLGSQGWDVSR